MFFPFPRLLQELATAKIENYDLKCFVLNNQYLGMVMQWEDRFYKANRAHTYLGRRVRRCVGKGGGNRVQDRREGIPCAFGNAG